MRNQDRDDNLTFSLSKKEITLLFAAAMVIFLLVFILGAVVGRKMAPAHAAVTPPPPAVHPVRAQPKPRPPAKKTPSRTAPPDAPAPDTGPDAPPPPPVQDSPTPKPAPEKPAPPTTAKKSEPKPPVPVETEGMWTVQVASSTDRNRSVALAKKLGTAGYPSYVVQSTINGETYHRVRVGRFTAREKAEAYKQKLVRDKVIDAGWVTRNE